MGLALRQPLEELPVAAAVAPQAETGVLVREPDPPLPLRALPPPRALCRALSSRSAALHSSCRSSRIPWMSADRRSVPTPVFWAFSWGVEVAVQRLFDLNPALGLSELLGRCRGFDSERGSELER